MGVSRENIFSGAPGPQPAAPGTYGEAPKGFRLPDTTRLGRVSLQVSDLARSLDFYQGTLGLHVVDRTATHAALAPGDGASVLVELHERAGARPVPRRGRLGLYHFAILLPDRPSLGRFLEHARQTGARTGSADHLVSEALYLQDPDNLGIEIYADRPRDAWKRAGRELMMATDPLDVEGLLRATGGRPWSGMPPGTVMGHVHLHVGQIPEGMAFFSDALGFDRTVWHYPGALFLSAGGYHHHLGTNTWSGPGATAPAADEARLLEWNITLPDAESLAAAGESVTRAGFKVESQGADESASLLTSDPWGTPVRLTVATSPERSA